MKCNFLKILMIELPQPTNKANRKQTSANMNN